MPASLSTRTVTGIITAEDGTAAVGTVTFVRRAVLQGPSDGLLLAPSATTATLDGSGAISVALPVTDDADWSPTGWVYEVQIVTDLLRERWETTLPAGASVDLASLRPADGVLVDPPEAYVTSASVGTVGGPAGTLDGSGLVPVAQIPAIAQSGVTGLTAALAARQPVDADLTAIAALTPADDDVLQRKSGAWTNRTLAQLTADLGISGGGVTTADSGYVTSGNIAATSGSWTQVAADVTIAAAAGDVLVVTADVLCAATGGDLQLDAATIVSGSITTWVSSADGSGRWPGGIAAWYIPSGFTGPRCSARYTVQAGDIVSGQVTLRLLVRSSGSDRTVYQGTSYPSRLTVDNLG